MMKQDPVKIPDVPGKISFQKNGDTVYVRYLTERTYNEDRKYMEPKRILIGRQVEGKPGLMIPNDNYERLFGEEAEAAMNTTTADEQQYMQDAATYNLYVSFFDGLYNEFRQQTRRKADEPVNAYKARSINQVLRPLREMMKDEEYADFLDLIETGECNEAGEGEGMTYSDAMILMTQYKSALGKYRRNHG